MAERPKPQLLRIRDAMLEYLRLHAGENGHLWARVPAVIVGDAGVEILDGPAPAIVVPLEGRGTEQGARQQGYGRTRHTFTLVLYTREAGRAQEAIVDLWTDVRRALSGDSRLMQVDDGALSGGALFFGDYQIGTADDESGEGVAVMDVIADFYWGPDAP